MYCGQGIIPKLDSSPEEDMKEEVFMSLAFLQGSQPHRDAKCDPAITPEGQIQGYEPGHGLEGQMHGGLEHDIEW